MSKSELLVAEQVERADFSSANIYSAKPPAVPEAVKRHRKPPGGRVLQRSHEPPPKSVTVRKYQKIRPLVDQMDQAYGKYAQVVQNELLLAQAEECRNQMSAQVNAANAALSKMPNGPKANSFERQEYQAAEAIRDGLVQERDASSAAVDALRRQQFRPERKEELAKDFTAKRTDFLKAAAELAKSIEKAKEEYRELQGDSAVKDALAAIRRSRNTGAALGPSKNLQDVIDTIRKADRAYSPETNAPKKKRQKWKR